MPITVPKNNSLKLLGLDPQKLTPCEILCASDLLMTCKKFRQQKRAGGVKQQCNSRQGPEEPNSHLTLWTPQCTGI